MRRALTAETLRTRRKTRRKRNTGTSENAEKAEIYGAAAVRAGRVIGRGSISD
jgi:hypothetical protein